MAQGLGIDLRQEVDPGHQGVDAHRQFLARRHPQQGAIVANTQDHVTPLRPKVGEVGADQVELRHARLSPGRCPEGNRRGYGSARTPPGVG